MPPHLKVSKATKAAIDCTEMDAQLEALRRNIPVRITTSDRTSARFLSMFANICYYWLMVPIIQDYHVILLS